MTAQVRVVLVLAFPASFLFGQASVSNKGATRVPHGKSSAKPSQPPIQFDELLDRVRALAEISPAPLLNTVRERCVGFAANTNQIQQLREAHASEELLKLIPIAPAPPPCPKQPVAGTLTVRCNIPDCSVSVNGKKSEVASGGMLELRDLRAEETVVRVSREGFIPAEKIFGLTADLPTAVTFELAPDPSIGERAGEKLFMRLLRALGGLTSHSGSLTAVGQMNAVSDSGTSIELPVVIDLNLPTSISISTLKGKKPECTASVKLPISAPPTFACAAKNTSGMKYGTELQQAATAFASHYVPAVADELLRAAENARLSASNLSGISTLTAEFNSERFEIEMSDRALPLRLTHTDSGKTTWVVQYASPVDLAQFPMKMTIAKRDSQWSMNFSFTGVDARK